MSFARGQSVFTLVTLHIYYGNTANDRVGELKKIAAWMAGWGGGDDLWERNLMALGDFNIDRQFDEDGNVDELYKAFTETGLRPPDNVNNGPRTIFDNPDPNAPADERHFYDQIAWFTGVSGGPPAITFQYRNAGTFDFASGLVPADSTNQLSFRMSDHFPLWVEFDV